MRQALRSILGWVRRRRLVVAICLALATGLWLGLPRIAAHLFYSSSASMRHAYRTWRASSHRDVRCSACHDQPGIAGMAGVIWANMVQSPGETGEQTSRLRMGTATSERCSSCHPSAEMPTKIVYQLMTVTHKEHLDRGADCLDCHANVVHTGDGPLARTPSMESCLVCHDGDEASDRCCLCHLDLGDGHPPRYVADYPDPHRSYLPLPEDNVCRRCHADDVHDWTKGHEEAAQQKRESCRACHQDEFCRSCHTRGRPESHIDEYRAAHGRDVRRAPDSCRACHAVGFCLACHRPNPPQTHQPPTWAAEHSGTAAANRGVCLACHPADYCDACHRGVKPGSHDSGWSKSHGRVALKSRARCLECHSQPYCDTCHRVPMPHPRYIQARHGSMALGPDKRYCSLCHPAEECSACHQKSKPASHRAQNWLEQHVNSEADDSRCALCHGSNGCMDCHGLPMPHPDDWLLKAHGLEADETPDVCTRCHKPHYCMTCHESVPPKSHEANDFDKTHGVDKDRQPVCALCHGRSPDQDACLMCHKGVAMPHPEGYALEHKEQGSYEADGPCLACHELDYCKVCHDDVP